MDRKIEFDILKGILIIFVVTGHLGCNVGFDVFWFHMPAFFMITGYLTSRFLSYKDVLNVCSSIKNRRWDGSCSKFNKFIVPYFSYCILFYIIFHTENILKNIVRVLYAGWNNITIYSYQFWYINALMFGLIYYGSIKDKKWGYIPLIFVYLLIHTDIFKLLPFPLPWGMDEAFGAVIFIALGNYMKKIDLYDKKVIPIALIPVAIVLLTKMYEFKYELNMKSMTYDNLLLDIIIPMSFTLLFLYISKAISHILVLKDFLSKLGESCMTIYFTHVAFILLYKSLGMTNLYVMTIIIVISGLMLHQIFKINRYTSFLFLGTKLDYR